MRIWPQPTSAGTGAGLIVQVWLAVSVPLAVVASTSNVCTAIASPGYVCGDEHAVAVAPSSEHVNVAPGTTDENSNVAMVLVVVRSGAASIVTSASSAAAGSCHHSW